MQNANTTDTTTNPKEQPKSDSDLPPSGNGVGGETPPSANQNGSDAKSPKVQFAGTTDEVRGGKGKKDGGESEKNVSGAKKKWKRSFKNAVLREKLISTGNKAERSSSADTASASTSSAKRGILKLRGESSTSRDESEKQSLCFDNRAYMGDDDTLKTDDVISSPPPPPPPPPPDGVPASSVATTSRSAFPFASRRPSEGGFAGVVELLIQRDSLDMSKRDQHPFGRDGSVETILESPTSPNPKRQDLANAFSKLVVWVVLVSFLVGTALGLIFLSETYNAKLRQQKVLTTASNSTDITMY